MKLSEIKMLTTSLFVQIEHRYATLHAWKARALNSAAYFTLEEVLTLRQVVFNATLSADQLALASSIDAIAQNSVANGVQGENSGIVTAASAVVTTASAADTGTGKDAAVSTQITDEGLLDNALLAYYPRCPLSELQKVWTH